MTDLALPLCSPLIIRRPKLIIPNGPMVPLRGIADHPLWDDMGSRLRKEVGTLIHRPIEKRLDVLWMAGTTCNFFCKSVMDLVFGKTAYTGPTTAIYFGLYTAAIDDTLVGNTAGEIVYTSYARLALTDNATIFAAGSGTSTYTKTFPSDATKSWATATGNGNSPATYLGGLDGNAGTTADKGLFWCTVTSTTINNGDTPQLAQNAVSIVSD